MESSSDEADFLSTNESESSNSILPRTSDSSSDGDLPFDIAKDKSESPIQPKVNFPSRSFGVSGSRAFQARWYSFLG